METIKRIGVLTSGGDCSGLNTAIWAVTSSAISKGWEVFAIENATDGLIVRPMRYRKLTMADFNFPYAKIGGTMLGTNNSGNPNILRRADGTIEELTNEQFNVSMMGLRNWAWMLWLLLVEMAVWLLLATIVSKQALKWLVFLKRLITTLQQQKKLLVFQQRVIL